MKSLTVLVYSTMLYFKSRVRPLRFNPNPSTKTPINGLNLSWYCEFYALLTRLSSSTVKILQIRKLKIQGHLYMYVVRGAGDSL